MLEKDIEAHLTKKVKVAGGVAYKFTSPQRRSVPDRLVLLDVAKAAEALRLALSALGVQQRIPNEEVLEHHAAKIVAAMVHFVEAKAPGGKPTPGQLREHARLRAMGFDVQVFDSKEQSDKRYRA